MNLVDRLFNGNRGGGGITPSGTISITENGEGIDVSSYAYADVNVSGGGGGATIPSITTSNDYTYTCDIGYDGWYSLLENSPYIDDGAPTYPVWGSISDKQSTFLVSFIYSDIDGILAVSGETGLIFHDDGTYEVAE